MFYKVPLNFFLKISLLGTTKGWLDHVTLAIVDRILFFFNLEVKFTLAFCLCAAKNFQVRIGIQELSSLNVKVSYIPENSDNLPRKTFRIFSHSSMFLRISMD